MAVINEVVEVFSVLVFKLDHFERDCIDFANTLRYKHYWDPDQALWSRFTRFSYLKQIINDVEAPPFKRHNPSTFVKFEEIGAWKLSKPEDARAIDGDVEKYIDGLHDAMVADVELLKLTPSADSTSLREQLGRFAFKSSIPSDDFDDVAVRQLKSELKTELKALSAKVEDIRDLQDTVHMLGDVKKSREQINQFAADLATRKRRRVD